MTFTPLELTLLLLGSAVLGVVAFRMMHLPPMLGYLAVGILIGPHALGLAESSEAFHSLAEFGVVFLMFSIGLEFSLPKLMAMRGLVFGLGMAQVVLTIVATMLFGWTIATQLPPSIHIGWQASFALGGALAMSSTAIVSKMLTERLELESEHGRKIIGILLFQDLAVVPLLILIPSLGQRPDALVETLAWAGVKAVIVLALAAVLRPEAGARLVHRGGQAALAGAVHAEPAPDHAGRGLDHRARRPVAGAGRFRGRHADFRDPVQAPGGGGHQAVPRRAAGAVLHHGRHAAQRAAGAGATGGWCWCCWPGPVLLKFALIAGLAKLFGASDGVSMRTGLALAQAGEFGFVLLNLAGGSHLMDPFIIQVVLASMVLSMLVAPFIISKSDQIVMKVSSNEWMMQSLALTKIASRTMSTNKHVIVCGFGRSGQSLATLLGEENIDYHALDLDPERVQEAQTAGRHVSYGDAARRESLIAAGIYRASAVVITYASTPSALKVLHLVHELAPTLPVIVRSYDDTDLDLLKSAGAAEVVPELMEGSLMLASHALVMLGVPLRRVVHRVQTAREERYASLRGYFHGVSDAGEEADLERLHSVTLSASAVSVGKALGEIDVAGAGAEVTSIRRGKGRLDVAPDVVLEAGDVVVLRGAADAVNRAEQRLLR